MPPPNRAPGGGEIDGAVSCRSNIRSNRVNLGPNPEVPDISGRLNSARSPGPGTTSDSEFIVTRPSGTVALRGGTESAGDHPSTKHRHPGGSRCHRSRCSWYGFRHRVGTRSPSRLGNSFAAATSSTRCGPNDEIGHHLAHRPVMCAGITADHATDTHLHRVCGWRHIHHVSHVVNVGE